MKQLTIDLAEPSDYQQVAIRNRKRFFESVDEQTGDEIICKSQPGAPFGHFCSRCNRNCQVNGGSLKMDQICPRIRSSNL
jgi:hypothetical protein